MKGYQKLFVKKRRLVNTTTFLVALLTVAILVFSGTVSAIDFSGNQKMLNNKNIKISIGAAKANGGNFIRDAKLNGISSSEEGRGQKFYAVDCSGYPSNSRFIWFTLGDPGTYHDIGPWPNTQFPQGATFVDDVEWVCDTVGNLWIVEEDTGVYTLVGSSGVDELTGIAYHESSGRMYGCSVSNFYEIDMVTGLATLIGALGCVGPMISIDCDNAGIMYGYDLNYDNSNFYSIDLVTGKATVIGNTNVSLMYGQDMAYDYDNGIMYACVFNYDTFQGELHTIDLITGKFSYQATLHGGNQTTCFAIRYNCCNIDIIPASITGGLFVAPAFQPRLQFDIINNGVVAATNVDWDIQFTSGFAFELTATRPNPPPIPVIGPSGGIVSVTSGIIIGFGAATARITVNEMVCGSTDTETTTVFCLVLFLW